MENELVSVVVPIYNVEKYIHKCIDSIINQTYKKLEIILVDDGSPDNCGKICDEYAKKDDRIIVIHKENEGVSSARNTGIEAVTGKWISFIDSDDWIEENYFEIMMNKANEKSADIVLCGYNRVNNNSIEKICADGKDEIYDSKQYLINALNPQTGFGFCHMKLIRTSCIKNIKFNKDLTVGEDALFNMQIAKNIKKAFFCRQAIYNYRNNNESVVKRYDENYVSKYLKAMIKTKDYIFKEYNEKEIIQNYNNFVAYHVMLIAVNYCYHPNNKTENKLQLLEETCNNKLFKESIKQSNYQNISLTRKITLFTLKHRLYFLTEIICRYRQKQNNGDGRKNGKK